MEASSPPSVAEEIDLTGDSPRVLKSRKRTASEDAAAPERRARRFRRAPPQTYLDKLDRATTQRQALITQPLSLHLTRWCRMFVIGRSRTGTEENPEENVDIVGTTGNIYRVTIRRVPSCTCPDALKGNQCKHIVYVGVLEFSRALLQ
jgi:hypothetical protein